MLTRELPVMASQDRKPLIDYAKRHCWGNPQINHQHQIRLARVSHALGYIRYFSYMGRQYLLPEANRFYYVFTLAGRDIGDYGLGTRVFDWAPFDRWINVKEYIEKRFVMLDFYNGNGLHYNRTDTWIMRCTSGDNLVAFVKNETGYDMPVGKPMYMHCYTPEPSLENIAGYVDTIPQLHVSGVTWYDYRNSTELKNIYDEYKALGYGRLTVYHNGYIREFDDLEPAIGDLIEMVLDASVERVLTFKYTTLRGYHSDRDKKGKLIILPWLTNPTKRYYYFDDNDFYVYNRRTRTGIYLHRNNQDCVRQLTHQDYGLAGDYVETVANKLVTRDTSGESTIEDIDIIVVYHRTRWSFSLGPTTSRIAELYLLNEPGLVLDAMSGVNATLTEWQANQLEQSPHNRLLGEEYLSITNEGVFDALGYNGAANVLSQTLFYMPGIMPGEDGFEDLYPTPPIFNGLGYLVPPSFRVSSTVYEYDKNGELLPLRHVYYSEWYRPSKDAVFCEYMPGVGTTWLDETLTKNDITLSPDYGYRVYIAEWELGDQTTEEIANGFWDNEWSVSKDGQPLYQTDTEVTLDTREDDTSPDTNRPWDGGKLKGEWVDITDTDRYTFDKTTGILHWNDNMQNYVGMVVQDSNHLYFEVTPDHLDHSLTFSLIEMWNTGGIVLPLRPAQIDVWIENKPLVENVDYVLDFPVIQLISKQYLEEGKSAYTFKVRAVGLSKDGPYRRSELGFVTNGVLGYNGRYNVRVNRPTKLVCNGRIWLTQAADWAETPGHGNNFNGLEGYPYEVKHYVCLNRYVEDFNSQKGIEEEEDRDYRIGQYLAKYVTYKSNTPPDLPILTDKYRLFSPFMTKLYYIMRNGFVTLPDDIDDITDQYVNLLSQPYVGLLKYDPITRGLADAYFAFHPLSDIGYQPITTRQLKVLERANNLYLKDTIRLRGHFEVVNE